MSTIEMTDEARRPAAGTGPTSTTAPSFLSGPRARVGLDLISFLARFGMAGIWLWAGFSKLGNEMGVAQSVLAYEMFTPEVANFIALVLPPLEIAAGLMLLLGIFLRPTGKITAFVLGLFTIGLIQAWVRGLAINCGCFTVNINDTGDHMTYFWAVLRDLGFLALSLWTAYRPFRKWALHP
ncbi:DoxX family protein [Corynebacterium halotolerans]|uniref:Methylamine utilisation protein MauE domain-containing protein n=1 Tax=Corynebacterium halotolerans YIM 70093 = DSM 44683 TaxID=1121362 RepID=M1NPM4_9CORY|nr:DoxX family protein [Corynebacterium halotolerans]AGF73338.1 hypothetical protein A605_11700 [Corynebacterium halotolerans YIM 70093 = DSM 44683]